MDTAKKIGTDAAKTGSKRVLQKNSGSYRIFN